jgi:hypothetical protein
MTEDPAAELKQAKDDIDKALDVVDLLVVLLEICRRHAKEVVDAAQGSKTRRQLRQESARLAEESASAFASIGLSTTTKEFAKVRLERTANLAVTARALALAIDEAVRRRDPKAYIKLCAKWQSPRELTGGDPYPTPSVNLSTMYGDVAFSRRPRRSSATAFDRVDGLALWPSPTNQPLSVIYDTDAGAYLDSAMARGGPVSILAVLPNGDFEAEFRPDEVQTDTDSKQEWRGRFFGMRPKNAVNQDEIVEKALREASALDVDIMVTPECSSTTGTVQMIRDALQKVGDRGPRVVIAGGLHVQPTPGERRNRMSTVYATPNPPVFEHDKIGEYIASGAEEDIDRSTKMRIHAGINWSMIPLICADLLDDAVVDAVGDLCPRLVIVPSMSSKTGDFEMSIGAVIRKSQALAVVVNGPPHWPGGVTVPTVVIGRPLAKSWIGALQIPASVKTPYAALIYSDDSRTQFVSLK